MTKAAPLSLHYQPPNQESLLKKLQSFDPALHGGEVLIDVPVGRELFLLPNSSSV